MLDKNYYLLLTILKEFLFLTQISLCVLQYSPDRYLFHKGGDFWQCSCSLSL